VARGYEGRELNRGIRRREGRKIKTDGRSQCHNISYDGVVTVGGSDGQDCPRLSWSPHSSIPSSLAPFLFLHLGEPEEKNGQSEE